MAKYKNPTTGAIVDTAFHPTATGQDLANQGWVPVGEEKKIEATPQQAGGTLFSGTPDKNGQSFQTFVPNPANNQNSAFAPATPAEQKKENLAFNTATIPKTADTVASAFAGNQVNNNVSAFEPAAKTALQAPAFATALSPEQEKIRQQALDNEVERLQNESQEQIYQIQQKGKQTLGASTAFLAKLGALGRTISGAPMETNLGVLSSQNNLITKAVEEERQNLKNAISQAKTASADAAQKRIDELNKLTQQNFENAFKLVQEDRAIQGEQRETMLADLQRQKLNFDITKSQNEVKEADVKDALEDITRMAESGVGLDQVSAETINELETRAGIPTGSFEAYYQAKQDAKRIANQENLAKVKKIEQDILNSVRNVELEAERVKISQQQAKISQQNANTSAFSASTSSQRLAFDKEKEKETGNFKFTSNDSNRLIAAGFNVTDVAAIQDDFKNGATIDQITNGMAENQKQAIQNILSGEKGENAPKFLTENYIRKQFTEGIKEKYPLEEYDTLGWQSTATKEKRQQADIDKEINEMIKQIEELRATGLSDKEIDNLL